MSRITIVRCESPRVQHPDPAELFDKSDDVAVRGGRAIADKWGITRDDPDAFGFASHSALRGGAEDASQGSSHDRGADVDRTASPPHHSHGLS